MNNNNDDSTTKPSEPPDKSFSNIIFKLNKFVKLPACLNYLQSLVIQINKISLEAHLFSNFYCLHCISNNIPLSFIDQTFFYRCCALVSTNKIKSKNPDAIHMSEIFTNIYSKSRPSQDHVNNYEIMNCLAQQMYVEATNHLVLNFYKRLTRYVHFKFNIPFKEVYKFIKNSLNEINNNVINKNELAKWLVYPLDESHIKTHFTHFMHLSYDMLEFINSLAKRTKHAKRFSILPLKNGFSISHITINNQGLRLLLNDIINQNGLIIKKVNDKHENKHDISKDEFIDNKDIVWRELFNITSLETANKIFAHQITTNGYSVSVLMKKGTNMKEISEKIEIEEQKQRVIKRQETKIEKQKEKDLINEKKKQEEAIKAAEPKKSKEEEKAIKAVEKEKAKQEKENNAAARKKKKEDKQSGNS